MRTRLRRMGARPSHGASAGMVRPPAIVSSAIAKRSIGRTPASAYSRSWSGEEGLEGRVRHLELRSETLEQAGETGSDAGWRHPEFATDLGRIEAGDVAEGEQRAVLRREAPQGDREIGQGGGAAGSPWWEPISATSISTMWWRCWRRRIWWASLAATAISHGRRRSGHAGSRACARRWARRPGPRPGPCPGRRR